MVIHSSQKFEEVTKKVFSSLLKTFPMAIELNSTAADFEIVGGYTAIPGNTFNEHSYTSPSPDQKFFAATVTWLKNEEYLTYEKVYPNICKFENVILTQKGLDLLGAVPACLKKSNY